MTGDRHCRERPSRPAHDPLDAGPEHVLNLSHGITPDVPPENIAVLIETVHRGH